MADDDVAPEMLTNDAWRRIANLLDANNVALGLPSSMNPGPPMLTNDALRRIVFLINNYSF